MKKRIFNPLTGEFDFVGGENLAAAVDIRQVEMGTLHIDPEGCIIENGKHPQINSEESKTLGGTGAAAFIINPEFIGFERKGDRYGLFFDENTHKFTISPLSTSSSSGLTVTTYPYPSQRNIEVQENAFTFIWQNITVPANSEVYARVTVNLNASPAEGQRIALGFLSEGQNIAATAAPLPVVSSVEHSMCLQHWFEKETTLAVAVHSTTTAYVTNIVSPLDAKMNGGTELIIKTFG